MTYPARLPIDSMTNPFTLSMNPQSPANNYSPYNYHNNYIDSPAAHRKQPNQVPSRASGPTETLNLNDNVSFARNFKGRLYSSDPQEELSKHKSQEKYKEQLRIQIEDDRRRKAVQKEKDEAWDLHLEQKFYENIEIEAQPKGNKKQQPNYFVMHSSKARRKHPKHDPNNPESKLGYSMVLDSNADSIPTKEGNKRTAYTPPKIMKRGGYHNQSSLDHTKNYPSIPDHTEQHPLSHPPPLAEAHHLQQNPPPLVVKLTGDEYLKREMLEQEDRINQLMLFQQNMLRKLDYFKKEIYQTTRGLKLQEQFELVKLKLRAKTINMQKVHSVSSTEGLDDILENSEMYQLPLISKKRKVYEGDREGRKKKGIPPHRQEEHRPHQQEEHHPPQEMVHLADRKSLQNDKNLPPQPYPQEYQEQVPYSQAQPINSGDFEPGREEG